MTDIAIRVEKLGKRYRIGARQAGYRTIRETVMDLAAAPVRRLRRLGQPMPEEETIWALKDVSFEVNHGEVLGIIGRNGAGKTTLLKILSRITEPTEGRAEILGRVGSLLEVGTGFHPELTGRENVYLNGAILGMKRAEIDRKFDEIVEFSGIEKFLDTPVKRYSSGMYVRLAFAVAAHLEPEILLVDEVLAVGDTAFQKKCLGKMEGVAREGRTVLFVSHNMRAVQELCARAMLLADGGIVEDGPAPTVISDYLAAESRLCDGEMDVSDPLLRRDSLADSRFRWTRVTLVNSESKPTAMLGFGEPFAMIIEGVADTQLYNVRLGFSITSALGVPMFNSFQLDSGIQDPIPAGRVRFRIRVEPNLLAPGLYEIGLGANGLGVIDWLPTTLKFTISTIGPSSGMVWEDYRGGLLRYPCEWQLVSSVIEQP